MTTAPRILLGVTADESLILMSGFPSFLVSKGWEVHLVASPGPRLAALSTVDGVHAHELPMRRNPAPIHDLISLFRWIRLVRQVRPDVVSVGTPKAGLLGGLASFLNRVPSRVYQLRGLRLETSRGLSRELYRVLERAAAGSAHVVLSVSRSLSAAAVRQSVVKPAKIEMIGEGSSNGVDTDRFRPKGGAESSDLRQQLGIEAEVPVVGFVGRLTRDKGLDVLAEACELLVRRNVEHQLLVVGGIDSARENSASQQFAAAGGRPAIVTGHVADTQPFYAVMDVFCLPTLREGFPNVVLEASASEIPVVTTDATGAVDSVASGRTGLIAAAGSAHELANQLEALINDATLRKEMGEAARKWTIENFDRENVWNRTESFYRGLYDRDRN